MIIDKVKNMLGIIGGCLQSNNLTSTKSHWGDSLARQARLSLANAMYFLEVDSDLLWFFYGSHAMDMEYVSIQLGLCSKSTLQRKLWFVSKLCNDRSHLHYVLFVDSTPLEYAENEDLKFQTLVATKLLSPILVWHMFNFQNALWTYNLHNNPPQHGKTLGDNYCQAQCSGRPHRTPRKPSHCSKD